MIKTCLKKYNSEQKYKAIVNVILFLNGIHSSTGEVISTKTFNTGGNMDLILKIKWNGAMEYTFPLFTHKV